jgi:hypothetical protein
VDRFRRVAARVQQHDDEDVAERPLRDGAECLEEIVGLAVCGDLDRVPERPVDAVGEARLRLRAAFEITAEGGQRRLGADS